MNFESFAQVMWRQRLVLAAVLMIGLVTFGFALSRGRTYSASSVILAGGGSSGDAVVLDPTKNPIESAISPSDLPMLLHSQTVINGVAKELHLTPEHASKLAGHTKAKAAGAAAIPITVTDNNPDLAVAEANALARQLQLFEQQIAESRYDLLIRDLRSQLDQQRATLANADNRIAALTSRSPYVTQQTGIAPLGTRLVALETQRDQVRTQLLGDAAVLAKAEERPTLARDLAAREIVQNDPVFQNLRTQYGKDLAQYNQQRAGYTENFPGLAGAKDLVQREGTTLDAATSGATKKLDMSPSYVAAELDKNKAGATYASDRAQLSALDAQIAAMTQELNDSQNVSTQLDQLNREREAGNQAYLQLSDRLAIAIADRSQAASVNSIVLLDNAVGASPTMLSRPEVIFAAIAIAFSWLAISLAFLVDQSDGRLRTRTTIEELYGTSVLTTVN